MTDVRFTAPELQALYALLAPTDTGAPRAPLLKTSPPARAWTWADLAAVRRRTARAAASRRRSEGNADARTSARRRTTPSRCSAAVQDTCGGPNGGTWHGPGPDWACGPRSWRRGSVPSASTAPRSPRAASRRASQCPRWTSPWTACASSSAYGAESRSSPSWPAPQPAGAHCPTDPQGVARGTAPGTAPRGGVPLGRSGAGGRTSGAV